MSPVKEVVCPDCGWTASGPGLIAVEHKCPKDGNRKILRPRKEGT